MIFILSNEEDQSSSEVIEWLNSLKKNYRRINNIIDGGQKELFLHIVKNTSAINNGDVLDTVWCRKLCSFRYMSNKELRESYEMESFRLIEFLFATPNKSRKVLGVSFSEPINKLNLLIEAELVGLKIPDTIITNNKSELLRFVKKHKMIITKPISNVLIMGNKVTYTKLLTKNSIDKLPITFPTSLFQQYIDKEFEIRVFYLGGKLYPMAIFSGESKKTKIDFRNYDYKNMNRSVPYKLPDSVEKKLMAFMKGHKFESASADLIKYKNTGEYYFLEVNARGEFGMVSYPCNYYLEKKIAETL